MRNVRLLYLLIFTLIKNQPLTLPKIIVLLLPDRLEDGVEIGLTVPVVLELMLLLVVEELDDILLISVLGGERRASYDVNTAVSRFTIFSDAINVKICNCYPIYKHS